MKYQIILWALLASAPVFAEGPAEKKITIVACEAPESIEQRISSCTDDVIAEKAARACHDALIREWNRANAELASVMGAAKNDANTKQRAGFSNSHGDMQLAIDKLAELIVVTEKAADRIANYPPVMIDNPYAGAGLEGSSNCFKSPYLAISKIVKDLDLKADEGEDALATADKLRGVSQARDDGIATGYGHSIAGSHTSGIGSGHSQNRTSDITGLEQDKAKRRGVSDSGSAATVAPASPAVGDGDPAKP